MKMRSFFYLGGCLLLILTGCRENSRLIELPIPCTLTEGNGPTQRIVLPESEWGVEVPQAWAVQEVTRDSVRSVGAVDTSLLYGENQIRSITLTTLLEQVPNPGAYIASEIQAVSAQYELVNNGFQEINRISTYWLLMQEQEVYTLIYYIFGKNTYLINASCSRTEAYEEELCALIGYIFTLR
ncbi:hypothetical protein [Flavilitoribacter nigricans]|uniref:DUF1795 domain-containing protein n=1 Tax=Flavilitoribacter nigricans (strain ATCC 23147 / DSM 23189 / NBRC 102662 / NCIMB 1420 / SS-2) TaxID=1122177 RepID=A0A2D0N0L7_FLAN2|nr:hypothetical protein [Flavilitoribacter nigricans]PHN01906.1 hypothetical protein CRP01_34500 [Flavilitoribacter nigricans DSM 23189 = NBRC 102662]